MDKTPHTELHRLFLVERLPEPLTTASSHLQIFDTYIPNTRLRVRQMRDPATNNWTRILQQRYRISDHEHAFTKLVEMHLEDDEFTVFERMSGDETRKNRYFHEFDGCNVCFDVYLNVLRGLTLAKVEFDDPKAMLDYDATPFMKFEVTEDAFFDSRNLATASATDVEREIARLGATNPPPIPEE